VPIVRLLRWDVEVSSRALASPDLKMMKNLLFILMQRELIVLLFVNGSSTHHQIMYCNNICIGMSTNDEDHRVDQH
jgi:hypothetical protein